MDRRTRRSFLRAGVGSGLAGLAGCQFVPDSGSDASGRPATERTRNGTGTPGTESATEAQAEGRTETARDGDPPVDVRGALYLPARAWNSYQMWSNYDRSVVERDLGYAERVNLNAIRTWVNYEYWLEHQGEAEREFEHLLGAADERDIEVLVILFEGVGQQPTEENLTNTDPLTATTVASPGNAVVQNESRWDQPREYVRWVLDNWGDDDRLLGVEVMNEPGWSTARTKFSRGMFRTMDRNRGSVPLTVGSTSLVNDLDYADWGSDILQFHYNFPTSQEVFRDALRQVKIAAERVDQPVWLTEWQRVRAGEGFHAAPKPDQRTSDYSSMAPIIREQGFGNFFWSLMVKPAVVRSQRRNGILNGLFHEDGAVWSTDDARAIKSMSGDPSFDGEERREWPEWARVIKEEASS